VVRVSRHPVRIMHAHKSMYAFPAYTGSVAYQIVRALGLPLKFRVFAGVAATLAMRFYADRHGWRMPVLNAVYQHTSVRPLMPSHLQRTDPRSSGMSASALA